MTAEQRHVLIQSAIAARRQAYAPYSGFQVGAALLTTDGQLYQGANVENASYGLTMCAERVVIATAVSAGKWSFTAIAVASSGGCRPCGACRQVIAEFCRDIEIVLVDSDDAHGCHTTTLSELLPQPFDRERP